MLSLFNFRTFFLQSAKGWDYQEELSKHESQTDAAKGFGGKYGVQTDKQDKVPWSRRFFFPLHNACFFVCLFVCVCVHVIQSAVGWEYQAELSKHGSQKDASKGFGGKYGVEKDKQDKVSYMITSLPTYIEYEDSAMRQIYYSVLQNLCNTKSLKELPYLGRTVYILCTSQYREVISIYGSHSNPCCKDSAKSCTRHTQKCLFTIELCYFK